MSYSTSSNQSNQLNQRLKSQRKSAKSAGGKTRAKIVPLTPTQQISPYLHIGYRPAYILSICGSQRLAKSPL